MNNILSQAFRSLLFIALVATAVLLIGCGGSGSGGSQPQPAVNPFNGLKYSGNSLALGSVQGSLALNVAATMMSGTLIVSATPAAKAASGGARPAAVAARTYSFSGSFTGSSPNFSATFSNLSNSTVSGTLPTAPATTGGSFSLKLNGTVFGPFTFGATVKVASFHVDEIGLLAPGAFSDPEDLNDSGEVVGSATDANDVGHAFSWTKGGGLKDLGLFGGQSAAASGINNGGTIVGTFEVPGLGQNVFKPFITAGSNHTPGAPPGCDNVSDIGITNEGGMFCAGAVFTGDSEDPVGTFVFTGGKYQSIGVPAIGTMSQIKAFGKDYVFGYDGSPTSQATTLWEWDGTTSRLFDWQTRYQTPMPGWAGVGPNGDAFGSLKNGDAGILSANGVTFTDLGHPGAITALNASEQAVGNFTDATGQHGFFWTKTGGFKDLNTMIDPGLGVTIFAAVRINANGQIICFTKSKTVSSGLFGIGALLTPN